MWDDGTLAAPLAVLKDDAGEPSPAGERGSGAAVATDAGDPDFSLHAEQAVHGAQSDSGGRGSGGGRGSAGAAPAPADSEEEAYSDDSPRASA